MRLNINPLIRTSHIWRKITKCRSKHCHKCNDTGCNYSPFTCPVSRLFRPITILHFYHCRTLCIIRWHSIYSIRFYLPTPFFTTFVTTLAWFNIVRTAFAGNVTGGVPKNTITNKITKNTICPPTINTKFEYEKSSLCLDCDTSIIPNRIFFIISVVFSTYG